MRAFALRALQRHKMLDLRTEGWLDQRIIQRKLVRSTGQSRGQEIHSCFSIMNCLYSSLRGEQINLFRRHFQLTTLNIDGTPIAWAFVLTSRTNVTAIPMLFIANMKFAPYPQ